MNKRGNSSFNPKKGGKGRLQQEAILKNREQAERKDREQMARKKEELEELEAMEYYANCRGHMACECDLCGARNLTRRCVPCCDPERKAKWLQGQRARDAVKRKAREQEEQAARERAEKEAEKHAKELPKIQAQNTFIKYCKDGDLDTVKSLWKTVDIRYVYRDALYQACVNGHIEIVKLLCDKLYNEYPGESRGYTSYNWHAFTLACDSGHMELAKHLVDDLRLDVSVGNDEPALIAACAKGHLEIAQWIASQNVNISTSTYASSLKEACKNDHLNVAKWIFQVEYFDKIYDYPRRLSNYNIGDGFFESCLNGRLDIVQWLFPIMNANRKLTSKLEDSFSIAGGYDKVPKHPEVVNWLLQKRPDLAI